MMDIDRAKEIIEGSANQLLIKSNEGTLYVKIELSDIDSAIAFHKICFTDREALGNGITITEINWGVTVGQERLEEMRSQMLDMVKSIRPLDCTEY
jgi:hypothetical protein